MRFSVPIKFIIPTEQDQYWLTLLRYFGILHNSDIFKS